MLDQQEERFSERQIRVGLNILIDKAYRNAKAKGFWDRERNDGEMIALMHSELSEALEELRRDRPFGDIKDNVAAEFADVIIRIADFCGGRNIDLGTALIAKLRYNEGREYKHGKKF